VPERLCRVPHQPLSTNTCASGRIRITLRCGHWPSVGKVLAASAATVAVTFSCMIFVRLGLLSTIGPALAVSVGVVFLAAVTLLPAILVLAGRRGWIAPRRDLTTSFWRRSGIRIARRPAIHLVASLVVLVTLAACGCFVRYNWDESKTLPDSVESNRGSAAVARHFPLNSTIPQYLLIQSQHDLLCAADLLAERRSQRRAQRKRKGGGAIA